MIITFSFVSISWNYLKNYIIDYVFKCPSNRLISNEMIFRKNFKLTCRNNQITTAIKVSTVSLGII